MALLGAVAPAAQAQVVLQVYDDPGFCCAADDAGDVDNDGVPDVVLAAPGWFPPGSGSNHGLVKVLSGTGATIHTFLGAKPGDDLGWSVSAAGDANADGFPDIVIGGVGIDPAGWAGVYSGSSGTLLHSIAGINPIHPEVMGYAVRDAGDLNGDGFDDVAVGAPGDSIFGKVYTVSGKDGSSLYVFAGDPIDDGIGWALAAADVDLDGVTDVITGAKDGIDGNGQPGGSVLVYSGASGQVAYRVVSSSPTTYPFGATLDTLDDIDGDGRPELLIGAPFDFTVGPKFGAVYAYSAPASTPLYGVFGPGKSDFAELGRTSLATLHDFDGDGLRDFAVCADSYDGVVTNGGFARVYSGADGSTLFTLHGKTSVGVGRCVTHVGDVNHDGIAEFLIGSSDDHPADGVLYSGRCALLRPYGQGCPGSYGATPSLTGSEDCLTAGSPLTLSVAGGAPGGAGLLLFGVTEAEIPIGACFLNVFPVLPLSIPLLLSGTGEAVLNATFPPGVSSGLLTMQAVVVDPAAPFGAVGSNGLALRVP